MRIRADFNRYDFGLWAVEQVDDSARAVIGFVGLSVPRFTAPFTPCIEIGWRLAPEHWGAGLATETAQADKESPSVYTQFIRQRAAQPRTARGPRPRRA